MLEVACNQGGHSQGTLNLWPYDKGLMRLLSPGAVVALRWYSTQVAQPHADGPRVLAAVRQTCNADARPVDIEQGLRHGAMRWSQFQDLCKLLEAVLRQCARIIQPPTIGT